MVAQRALCDHFALGFRDYDYVGEAPDFWAFRGRMFGGYTAAATLLAAARLAPPGWVALSASISFFSAATVGPYSVAPSNVRVGKSSAAINVTTAQDEHVRATMSAWFVQPDILPTAHNADDHEATQPDAHLPATWRDAKNPFDVAYQRRAVRYPDSRDAYPAHGPDIELWIRLKDEWKRDSPLHRQAADLLLLDAHMAETLVDGLQVDPVRSFSMDLAVRWSDAVLTDSSTSSWRRLVVHGEGSGRIGVARAQLLYGRRLAAEATQHVAIGPPRDTAHR